jgi:hypothetical protein
MTMSPADHRTGLFALELAAFAAIFWLDQLGMIPLSKTPFLLAVAWASMGMRGITWRAAGLTLSPQWRRWALIGFGVGAALWAFEFFVSTPVLFQLTGKLPDLSTFNGLVGNIQFLLILLAANIVLAVFGEEMIWRGYSLPRVAGLLGGLTRHWVATIIIVNVIFGVAHDYQGISGVVQNVFDGTVLGVLYFATGRNLVAPMCAHFVTNTIVFIVIYLGLHPGMGAQ